MKFDEQLCALLLVLPSTNSITPTPLGRVYVLYMRGLRLSRFFIQISEVKIFCVRSERTFLSQNLRQKGEMFFVFFSRLIEAIFQT